MRSFIAIDFCRDVKLKIAELQDNLRPAITSGRWKYVDNFHLTLKFLDEINYSQIDKICRELSILSARHTGFSLYISRIGRFIGKDNIRVLWLGMDGETNKLLEIRDDIEEAMSGIGFPKENRQFKPHITIGQDIVPGDNFESAVAGINFNSFPKIRVDKIELFKSEQIGRKRVYTSLAGFKLSDSPGK